MNQAVHVGAGAEAEVGALLIARGAQRVLIVCQPHHREGADRVADQLGSACVGVFAEARQHVPRALADQAVALARQTGADWVLAHGGGTPVGLAKAIALELDVAIAAVPTTYAGSEATDIWGLTDEAGKQTGRDERVRPRLVVYDPLLTLDLPPERALPSLVNALSHSVEALYAEVATDEARQAAHRSLAPLWQALAGIGADPRDFGARQAALLGAHDAGVALGGAQMGLHHKLCHVIGGLFDTPHALTHTVVLPHVLGFNLPAAPAASRALAEAWSVEEPAAALFDRLQALSLPVSLAALGLGEADLAPIREAALRQSYPNPRPLDAAALDGLLHRALTGQRPSGDPRVH